MIRAADPLVSLIDRLRSFVECKWMHDGIRLSDGFSYAHGQRGYMLRVTLDGVAVVDITEPTLYRAAASALRDFDRWAADQECELTEALEVSVATAEAGT